MRFARQFVRGVVLAVLAIATAADVMVVLIGYTNIAGVCSECGTKVEPR